jgi:hypothetical protein
VKSCICGVFGFSTADIRESLVELASFLVSAAGLLSDRIRRFLPLSGPRCPGDVILVEVLL